MSARKRSIEQLVDEQVKKWGFDHRSKSANQPTISTVTLSRDPGSGGKLIAQGIAEALGFDMFHQNVIHEMAKSAAVSSRMLESLDEKGLSMLDDWVSSIVYKKHLWPDEYLQHLMKVIGTIGRHGRAVIVGRGANFILPPETTFRMRIIAPRAFRAQKVAQEYDIPEKDAERRILKTESDRRAFIRKYFHSEIADPNNYDMVLNTTSISLREAIEAASSILQPKI